MGDFAIFTEEIAMGLIDRGFELKGQTEKAWYFSDSVLLEAAVDELLKAFEDNSSRN